MLGITKYFSRVVVEYTELTNIRGIKSDTAKYVFARDAKSGRWKMTEYFNGRKQQQTPVNVSAGEVDAIMESWENRVFRNEIKGSVTVTDKQTGQVTRFIKSITY